MAAELALFPLNSVLFPGGELSVRVFELRYRRLLDECGRAQPFGVVRIRYGKEVGEPAFPYDIGCAAYVIKQVALVDGSLAVLAIGDRRFRILSLHVEEDGLTRASIEWLPPDPYLPIPTILQPIAETLTTEEGVCVADAGSFTWRLAEVLPLSLDEQQQVLEEGMPQQRMQILKAWLLEHPDDLLF